jgi:hypothetical protein
MDRWVALASLLLFAGAASAQDTTTVFFGPITPSHEAPTGRAIASLDATACLAYLESRDVAFETLDPGEIEGVGIPIRLAGPLDGVVIETTNHAELHEIIDCRLAVALLAWAPRLRAAGITAIRHYSTYRPGARVGGSGRPSGHSHALAIDVGRMDRGEEHLTILEAWEAREPGVAPCGGGPFDESPSSALLRELICAAVERELFQVVLTPHHDRAHGNHVHLEVRPGVDWTYVR